MLTRNFAILVYFLLLPVLGWGQRAGDLDRSFNYGRGNNYLFNQGYGSFEPNDANGNPLPNGTYVVELKKGPYSYGTKQIIINR